MTTDLSGIRYGFLDAPGAADGVVAREIPRAVPAGADPLRRVPDRG